MYLNTNWLINNKLVYVFMPVRFATGLQSINQSINLSIKMSFHTLTIIVQYNIINQDDLMWESIVTTVIIQWFIMILQCVNVIHAHAVHNNNYFISAV